MHTAGGHTHFPGPSITTTSALFLGKAPTPYIRLAFIHSKSGENRILTNFHFNSMKQTPKARVPGTSVTPKVPAANPETFLEFWCTREPHEPLNKNYLHASPPGQAPAQPTFWEGVVSTPHSFPKCPHAAWPQTPRVGGDGDQACRQPPLLLPEQTSQADPTHRAQPGITNQHQMQIPLCPGPGPSRPSPGSTAARVRNSKNRQKGNTQQGSRFQGTPASRRARGACHPQPQAQTPHRAGALPEKQPASEPAEHPVPGN